MTRAVLAIIATVAMAPAFAGDVSASIGISQPGFYGQINIGNLPRPTVIYAQPLWVHRPPKVIHVEPVYLHVPPGHEKKWSKHCAAYGACGRPVYFVREDWYQDHYAPRQMHASRGDGPGNGHDKGKGKRD